MNIKVRFAPSPTGIIHLGNARTALFNALAALRYQGIMLLRIEDTDIERSEQKFTELLFNDLQWLDIKFNEGYKISGNAGPYAQSARQSIYDNFYQQLLEQKIAYRCFCSEHALAIMRKSQQRKGLPPRYAGTCRDLPANEIEKKLAANIPFTYRFKVPKNQKISFVDKVKGQQIFHSNDIGDFIIRRSNGQPSFMFCNAVDDALMSVNLVLRGEDHLTNTPRQLLILQSLSLPEPEYGHISLIIGQDNKPLSKRNGSKSIQELQKQGFLAIAVYNYIARLGISYNDNLGLQPLDKLAQNFSFDKLVSSAAKYDEKQLEYWQKVAVSQLTTKDFKNWMGKEYFKNISTKNSEIFSKIIRQNVILPSEAIIWFKICFHELEYSIDVKNQLQSVSHEYFNLALDKIGQKMNINDILRLIKEKLQLKGKNLFLPMRLALTGRQDGPKLAEIEELLGIDIIKQRINNCFNLTKN